MPLVCFLFVLALPYAASAQTRIVNATVDTTKVSAPISKNIYGQFLEHGGDIVNTGVWSEMLVDRKFFYPVSTSAPEPPPVMGNAAGNPRFNRTPARWWAPIGGDDVVTMDTKTPYTGATRRWSSSVRKNRTASANPELRFAKATPTPDASNLPGLRAR